MNLKNVVVRFDPSVIQAIDAEAGYKRGDRSKYIRKAVMKQLEGKN